MKVKIYHNGDDVFVAWKPVGFIAECRGFALLRRRNGIEETVSTWVGFEDDQAVEGERRASTNWPIQKYQWTDYMANPGDSLQYRVLPMVGPDKWNLRPDAASVSDWTPELTLTHELSPHVEALFNRGIVSAQWVSRRLGVVGRDLKNAKLSTVISTPGDPLRQYLAGPLGARLFEMLDGAAREQREVYAALYELDDEQLLDALAALKTRAHVVLANGSVRSKGQDQNSDARATLRGQVDLHDRMTSPRALGHNKFLIICDDQERPRWVWTGSQNWTMTGLCTQANNAVLIDNVDLATEYRRQWDLLRDAGEFTPKTLKKGDSTPRDHNMDRISVRLWFTPTIGQVDLQDARRLIADAKSSILFLMFNPGPRETLLNQILDVARVGRTGSRLYIRGVVNQDPSTTTKPVHLFDQHNRDKADYDVVLPAAIDQPTNFFREELRRLDRAFAMVHSKVILIDPLGADPIVLTGSHNLGPKASTTNDENLLIIRNAPGLGAAYAANVMAIYNQYRWRYRRHIQPPSKRWMGLKDSDQWQDSYLKAGSASLREINFWVGE
jgi:phosphatidylserine/phosphatidylglycerophosphate/cardiolipin synthase-like enzyme